MTPREVVIRVADLNVGSAGDVLLTIGLGSCVAIALYDGEAKIGGLAHVLLPSPALSRRDDNPAKFPQTAVPKLVDMMTASGANPGRLTARIAGGASMFASLAPPGTIQMGERNVVASRQVLRGLGLPIVSEAVGGDYGRTVRLHVADGRLEVSSLAHGVQIL